MAKSYELITTNTDSLLLCLLAEKPMYGYQVIKELSGRSKGYFNFKEGTLYPALHRLETLGLIEGRWQLLSSGQQRKYYHITEKGHVSLMEKRGQWLEFLSAMNLIIQPAEA
ncbi:MAG: helix-turn-helix transcriptional regulator [Dehalococcoidales bacterium]|nr:helix-turn-helix transcriptional regulator [Dehalococcoidales bacterium]